MGDISLLPDDLRGREDQLKEQGKTAPQQDAGGLKMHVPDAMVDEDIEIIEVDEGDLAAVLSDEPFMTRLTYKLSLLIDQIKGHFSKQDEEAPPAKAPPQFFKPPKKGLISASPATTTQVKITPMAGTGVGAKGLPTGSATKPATGGMMRDSASSKARITPQTEVPRRVRVIKRVRKPVRVSLISAEDLAVLSVDVSKRKWTLTVFVILFAALLAGGYFLISSRLEIAKARLTSVQDEVVKTKKEADDKLAQWKQYEDLEAKIKLLQKALSSHVLITGLFDFLEQNTLKNVTYKNASWSNSGQLSLDVVADSFDDAGGQLIVMKRSSLVLDAVSSGFALTKNATTGEMENITFQMAVKLQPDAFKNTGLKIEQGATSTSMSTTTSDVQKTMP